MSQYPSSRKLTVGVTGSSGLIGSALAPFLESEGHRIVKLPRPSDKPLPPGLDAIVHLAGEPIASGRWTKDKMERIRRSRVEGTAALCRAMARADQPPKMFVCASAVGYYGDRGDEPLTEESLPGKGFLAEVAEAWENAARLANDHARVVSLRFGMILSPRGGALPQMLKPFKLGFGGRIGDGRQYWSWLTIDDCLRIILLALNAESLSGPVNAVSLQETTCKEFVSTLGRILHRPTIAAMPAWAARLAFGPMADEVLLAGAKVIPKRLLEMGFSFRHGELEQALRAMLRSGAA